MEKIKEYIKTTLIISLLGYIAIVSNSRKKEKEVTVTSANAEITFTALETIEILDKYVLDDSLHFYYTENATIIWCAVCPDEGYHQAILKEGKLSFRSKKEIKNDLLKQ